MRKRFLEIFFIKLLLLISNVFAQTETSHKQIELIKANQLDFCKYYLGQYKRLIGDVIFKHENSWLYCDSARLYTETNSIEAFGNVHIDENDTLTLIGKYLKYDGNTKKAEIHDSVVLTDRDMQLFTEHLYYDLNTRIAKYDSGGKIINKKNILKSKEAYYFSNEQMLFFKGDVVLENPKYTVISDTLKYNIKSEIAYFFGPTNIISSKNKLYCENGWYDTKNETCQFNKNARFEQNNQIIYGDSLFYDRNRGIARAIKNINIIDSTEKIIIKGNFAEFQDINEKAIVTDSALFIKLMDKDTFYLHADTLKSIKDYTTNDTAKYRKIFGYYKVKFYKSDIQGICDSLIYSMKDSLIKMYIIPVIWTNNTQLSAKYIEVKTNHKEILSFVLKEEGFIISERDSGQYNQIKGITIEGYFNNRELKKVIVTGNAQSLYYVEEEDSSLIGINKAIAEKIIIDFQNNEVSKIRFLNKPEGTLYPISHISQKETYLRNFQWFINKRPTKWYDIFVW